MNNTPPDAQEPPVNLETRRVNFINLQGQVYGRFTVLSFDERQKGRSRWFCQCQCGKIRSVDCANLRSGHSKSCGCLSSEIVIKRNTTHGKNRTVEYTTWARMKTRCYDPNGSQYKNYGNRGIRVCDRWLNSFENFLADMGKRPSNQHSIERKNNNGNYEPKNCKWALPIEQANNTRKNKNITFQNRTQSLSMWCRELNLSYGTTHARFGMGWSATRAFTEPIQAGRRQIN